MQHKLNLGSNLKADCLATSPVIVRVNDFTDDALKSFAKDFQSAMAARQQIIPVVIDSFGGQVYSLFGMADTIRSAQRQGFTVATYCASKAMSCGAALFSCGNEGYRFISRYGTIMVHQVRNCAFGKVEEMEIEVSHTRDLNEQVLTMISLNCGHHDGYWSEQIRANGNADIYLTPDDAVRHNLANTVRTPTLEISIAPSYTLR